MSERLQTRQGSSAVAAHLNSSSCARKNPPGELDRTRGSTDNLGLGDEVPRRQGGLHQGQSILAQLIEPCGLPQRVTRPTHTENPASSCRPYYPVQNGAVRPFFAIP